MKQPYKSYRLVHSFLHFWSLAIKSELGGRQRTQEPVTENSNRHNSKRHQLHVREKILNVKFECETHKSFLWGSRTTATSTYTTQLFNSKAPGFILKNTFFAYLPSARPYRRGGVKAGKYCPTQTLQEPGNRQHSGNKLLHLQKSCNTATYLKIWWHTYHVPVCNGLNCG